MLEKNDDVGGTWLENSYPGCRVDVSNLFYCYSFAQRDDWPQHFSTQEVLLDYFRGVADRFGLRPLIRFGTEVAVGRARRGDDALDAAACASRRRGDTVEADAIVSGVGQLNRPQHPRPAGRRHVRRARVPLGAVGPRRRPRAASASSSSAPGASAAQFVPEIAEPAAHLTILQRTPAWFLPTPDYRDDVEPEVAWLLQNVPGYTNWLRFWNFWQNVEGLMVAARVDPEWDDGGASVSQINELDPAALRPAPRRRSWPTAPTCCPSVMPDYPPFSKRFIRDDGAWARTIMRDDVDLVTSPIAEITPEGVRTEDGMLHEADVLIYGTGFTASDFLMPMRIVGRDGVELHDRWKGDARAYLGITLPGLPEPVPALRAEHQHRRERQHHLLLGVRGAPRGRLHRGAARARAPRRSSPPRRPTTPSTSEVDAENLHMAWGVSSVNTWYKNATGRTAQNWPFSLREYWQRTRAPDLEDFTAPPLTAVHRDVTRATSACTLARS